MCEKKSLKLIWIAESLVRFETHLRRNKLVTLVIGRRWPADYPVGCRILYRFRAISVSRHKNRIIEFGRRERRTRYTQYVQIYVRTIVIIIIKRKRIN